MTQLVTPVPGISRDSKPPVRLRSDLPSSSPQSERSPHISHFAHLPYPPGARRRADRCVKGIRTPLSPVLSADLAGK